MKHIKVKIDWTDSFCYVKYEESTGEFTISGIDYQFTLKQAGNPRMDSAGIRHWHISCDQWPADTKLGDVYFVDGSEQCFAIARDIERLHESPYGAAAKLMISVL
jgi:hypothetical protein